MVIDDIQKLIDKDESITLELKKTTGELKDAMHTACAFLNTDGGWLIFGVTPTSRRILGQDVNDNTLREISQALSGLEPAVGEGQLLRCSRQRWKEVDCHPFRCFCMGTRTLYIRW